MAADPALVKHGYGKGVAIYTLFSPAAVEAGDYPLPERRVFARNVVGLPSPPQPVSAEAPLTVETVIIQSSSWPNAKN